MSVTATDVVRFFTELGGPGVQPDSLSVVVQNREGVSQETIGPFLGSPIGDGTVVTERDEGSPDGVFYDLAYELDFDTYDFPGDFIIVVYQATLDGQSFPEAKHVVNFQSSSELTFADGDAPYATVDEADAYFLKTLDSDAWSEFGRLQKQRALYEASNDIDAEQYMGYKNTLTSAEQKRQFPRILPEHSGLFNLDTSGMPTLVKEACYVQAFFLLRAKTAGHDPNDRRDLQQFGLTQVGHGRSSESWDIERAANDRLCAAAREKLRGFLAAGADWGFGI